VNATEATSRSRKNVAESSTVRARRQTALEGEAKHVFYQQQLRLLGDSP